MIQPKRVAAIQDLSCFGRCALTVILPVLSSMGVQCCPVPTAVLSTHTGGYDSVVIKDTGGFIGECLAAWQANGIQMDSVYSGFLANAEQIAGVESFFAAYPNAFKTVDPVLGDHGRVYKTVNEPLAMGMKRLVSKADFITPNPTEACLLLDKPYKNRVTKWEAAEWLSALCALGPGQAVITGIEIENLGICNIGFDTYPFYIQCDYQNRSFPGTGDIFTSAALGALLTGESFENALCRATVFVEAAIAHTASSPEREGVFLEPALGNLYQKKTDRKAFKL